MENELEIKTTEEIISSKDFIRNNSPIIEEIKFDKKKWVSKESYDVKADILFKAESQALDRILSYYISDKLLRAKAKQEYYIVVALSIERQEKELHN